MAVEAMTAPSPLVSQRLRTPSRWARLARFTRPTASAASHAAACGSRGTRVAPAQGVCWQEVGSVASLMVSSAAPRGAVHPALPPRGRCVQRSAPDQIGYRRRGRRRAEGDFARHEIAPPTGRVRASRAAKRRRLGGRRTLSVTVLLPPPRPAVGRQASLVRLEALHDTALTRLGAFAELLYVDPASPPSSRRVKLLPATG